MSIRGFYYDIRTSRRRDAQLDCSGDVCTLYVDGELFSEWDLSEMKISDRVGNTARQINFPDGTYMETSDNDTVDDLLQLNDVGAVSRIVHTLETKKRFVAVGVIGTVLFCIFVIYIVIPFSAKAVAFGLPVETNKLIAGHTLETLDEYVFKESSLADDRQRELREEFDRLLEYMPDGFDYKLVFRQGGRFDANAVALPDGTVVITDELVDLAEKDSEISGVFAHELGHIVNRHGMRTLLQNSIITVMAVVVTGDVSSVTAGLPSFFIYSKYSRAFEKEADAHAVRMMRERGTDIGAFADILQRLSDSHGGSGNKMMTYISTHPSTDDRVDFIRKNAGR